MSASLVTPTGCLRVILGCGFLVSFLVVFSCSGSTAGGADPPLSTMTASDATVTILLGVETGLPRSGLSISVNGEALTLDRVPEVGSSTYYDLDLEPGLQTITATAENDTESLIVDVTTQQQWVGITYWGTSQPEGPFEMYVSPTQIAGQ